MGKAYYRPINVQQRVFYKVKQRTELTVGIKEAQAKAPDPVELNYMEFEKQAQVLTPAQKSLLKKIGECESGFRMVPNSSGKSSAFGIFQILKVHDKRASGLGVTRFTNEGNIKVAIDLFREQGTRPWTASKHCWNKK